MISLPVFMRRLELLRTPCWPISEITDYYGYHLDNAWNAFQQWSIAYPYFVPCADGQVNRFAFESFLAANKAETPKWLAASLGMTTESFLSVLNQREALGIIRNPLFSDCVIDINFREVLKDSIRESKFRSFASHSGFCKWLHSRLGERLNRQIQPLLVADSRYPDESDFAYSFDCITKAPLGLREQIWLNFKKPISLSPDKCAKDVYFHFKRYLKPFLLGREPIERKIKMKI